MTASRSEQAELIPADERAGELVPKDRPNDITRLLEAAIDKGVSVETMEKLVGLHERVSAAQAKAAFHEAMSGFRRDCPPIPRTATSDQFMVTRNGVKQPRKYADLESIEATIREPAASNGLSWRWGDSVIEGEYIRVPCIVSHVGGHSESSSVPIPVQSQAGASPQQKMGISLTYAQRYSIIAAFGLTTADEDTDGDDPGDVITERQAADLEALLEEVNADRARFLRHFKVDAVGDIRTRDYPTAIDMLNRKRRTT